MACGSRLSALFFPSGTGGAGGSETDVDRAKRLCERDWESMSEEERGRLLEVLRRPEFTQQQYQDLGIDGDYFAEKCFKPLLGKKDETVLIYNKHSALLKNLLEGKKLPSFEEASLHINMEQSGNV